MEQQIHHRARLNYSLKTFNCCVGKVRSLSAFGRKISANNGLGFFHLERSVLRSPVIECFPSAKNITKLRSWLSLGELEVNFLSNRAQIWIVGANNLDQTPFVVLNPMFGELAFITVNQSLLNFFAIRRFDVEADGHQP